MKRLKNFFLAKLRKNTDGRTAQILLSNIIRWLNLPQTKTAHLTIINLRPDKAAENHTTETEQRTSEQSLPRHVQCRNYLCVHTLLHFGVLSSPASKTTSWVF